MKHLEVLGEAPVVVFCCSLMLRHPECAHLLLSQTGSTLSLCGFVPNPQKLMSLVLSQGFERTGTESLPDGASNYTLVCTKKETKTFWKTHQPCPEHLRQHQALGKSYKRKPQLSWGLAGMERGPSSPSVGAWPGGGQQRSELLLVCLWAGKKAGLAKCSCQIWLTSTNLGLPAAICNWNICFLSTLTEPQKGRRLGKETLKM